MFDSFDDDEYDDRRNKTDEYFNQNILIFKNNFDKQLNNKFIECEDDEKEDFCKKSNIKNFDFSLNAINCEQIFRNTENQREKSVLESDNKLDLSNSNKIAKNKINLCLNRPYQLFNNSSDTSSSKSLKQKLLDLYLDESKRSKGSYTQSKYVSFSTNLLEKLVIREKYNTIVLNLYSQKQGYSFGFNIKLNNYYDSKSEVYNINKMETKLVSYEETDIFFYINTGEIPPILIDLVDHLNVNIFYDGCIILEIRDHRRKDLASTSNFLNSFTYDLNFVLLGPSMQTLLADINSITKTGNCIWTQEDKYALESQLLLATAQPLCLEPNPVVSVIKNKILSYKYRLSDRNLKKLCLRHSEAFKLRALKWHEYELPYPFRILKIRKKFSTEGSNFLLSDFMNKNEIIIQENTKYLNRNGSNDHFFKESLEKLNNISPFIELPPQNCILVKEFSKKCEKPKYTSDPNLIPIEEILLEAEDKSSKNNYSKILILQQSNDGVYYGQLSLRSDQKSKANFRLGSSSDAEKYIQQYIQIFNEDGRRKVNLKRQQLKKPVDDKSFPCSIKKSFQSIFPTANYNDKQVQSYQLVLQQQEQQIEIQQKNHIEQIRRSRSTSSDCSNSNLKNLVTQTSNPTSINNIALSHTPKQYPNIQSNKNSNINQTTNILQTSPNIITLNNKQETTEISNGILQYQKVVANSNHVNPTSITNNSNNVIQVLVPKLIQSTQNLNQSVGKISPINQVQNTSILTNAVSETMSKNSKKSPKNKTTPKRQTKKRNNSNTNNNSNSQVNLAPKTSTDIMNGDQNFKPKIINATSLNLLKKIPIDNRSVPVIVTLNSESNNGNKMGIKSTNEDSSPVKSASSISSPIKATTIQFLQKSTPVISLNTAQNKIPIYNQEITSVTPVVSSPIKKTNQELFKQGSEPIYITSPTTAKPIQSRQNFILPSVKTIPINSKANSQYLTTSASLDNQMIFNKQLNSNQQTTSVILLTNNSNSNIQKSNSLN